MKSEFAVATICHEYKGNPELMLGSLDWLGTNGYKVFVTDGGSSHGFISKIEKMGHHVLRSERGLRGQMESSLLAAGKGAGHVVYCEIDKYEFLTTRLERTLHLYRESAIEYAVIGRGQQEFMSFPPQQREIETAQNNLIGHELALNGDWVGGPAVMPASHTKALQDSRFFGQVRYGWGVPWYLLARAFANRLKIGVISTGCGVHETARYEFNPGYRLYQANHILGCFYEGLGKHYDWIDRKE